MTEPNRVPVTVQLVVGDRAELLTPTRGHDNPLQVPVADIERDTGIPRRGLPGRRLTAVVTETLTEGMTARDYRPA